MTPNRFHAVPPFAFAAIVALASGCVAQIGADEDETAVNQDELSCSGGCCGSRFNCRVPNPARREGCSGARIKNPATGNCEWPVRAGADRSFYDGFGNRIGELRSDAVHLNQGIRKHLGGRWLVYAFGVTVRLNDGRLTPASGWIAQSDLVDARRLDGYTLALDDPGEGEYQARWRMVPGNRARFENLYIHGPDGHPYHATDYLVRPYGLIHLTYSVPGFSLGGHATDSFPLGAIFHRARGVNQIEIPLYGPHGYRSRYSLHFAYGFVFDGVRRRYGWVAKEALEQVEDPPPPPPPADPAPSGGAHTCSARCCDGTLVTGLSADSAGMCVSASSPVCEGHDYVERARFDGSVAYERDRYCWAKCANRSAYHRVDGVTSGCTDAARAYCAQSGRGAFEDAIWDACQPQ